jgi:glycosyltransferase involved in cell wall biosynthesis
MADLSIIIPARNEEFLQRTIDDVFSNVKGNTEIIAILDGYWPDPGIVNHERLTLIHHSKPIGQRAATNEGVRLSKAKYIMKLDAHCAMAEGFDVELMSNIEYDWTVIPRMYTLHVFSWVCMKCGADYYQGPVKKDPCIRKSKNGKPCNCTDYTREIVWKRNKCTDYMWFDRDLRVRYFDGNAFKPYSDDIAAMKKKYSPKYRTEFQGEITDVMNGVGACWMLHRDRYWELGGMDEQHGSWGQMGVEVAMKAWLSGGRHVVNKRTWFAHLFRTQGGDFTFPYDNPGSAQEEARKYSRKLWLGNNWPKQTRRLGWLIDKFSPLPGWSDYNDDDTVLLNNCECEGTPEPFALESDKVCSDCGQSVDECEQDYDECANMDCEDFGMMVSACHECVEKSKDTKERPKIPFLMFQRVKAEIPEGLSVVKDTIEEVFPEVKKVGQIVGDTIREVSDLLPPDDKCVCSECGQTIPKKKLPRASEPTKGLVYYTDNRCEERIMDAVRKRIKAATNGHHIVSVSHFPIDFGENIVMQLERGALSMFKQILVGLKKVKSDVVFLVEHDVLYHPTHFNFTPDEEDIFYYNENVYKVCAKTGQALFYHTKQTSGLCAYKDLLIEHYTRRVERVQKEGFTRRMGFEPGTHSYPRGVDNYKAKAWMSNFPNVDIRHGNTFTANRFKREQFRSERSIRGWKLVDEVPGWGKTKGEFDNFIYRIAQN